MNQIMPDATERRAAALAEVNYMNDALIAAKETIGQLKADLHREEDRVIMMVEERDRYRHEALRFRKLLMKLVIRHANAAMILEEAKEIVQEIDEIDEAPTPPTAAIERLEAEFKGGSQNDDNA